MTLLHISISHDRAIVATDTTCYTTRQGFGDVLYWGNGEAVAATKIAALPHMSCLLASRGDSRIREMAHASISRCRDFDHASRQLAAYLPSLAALTFEGSYNGQPLRHEVHLVGWSPVLQSMSMCSFDSGTGYVMEPCQAMSRSSSLMQGRYGPLAKRDDGHAWTGKMPRDLESAVAYARAAVQDARSDDPSAPYGGRLIVAQVERGGVSINDYGDLGLPVRRVGADDLAAANLPGVLQIAPYATYNAYEAAPTLLSGVGYTQGTSVAGLAFTPATFGTAAVSITFDASGNESFDAQRIAAGYLTPLSNLVDPGGAPADYVGWSFASLAPPTLQLSRSSVKVATTRTKCTVNFQYPINGGMTYVAGIFTKNPVPATAGLSFYDDGVISVQLLYR